MKVMHILQSNRFSGAENVVCQIISMSKAKDIEMVYVSRDGQIRQALAERGIDFIPVKEMSFGEIKHVIEEYKPDVIHAHDRTAAVLAGKVCKNIPVVVHMHVNNNKGLKLLLKNAIFTFFSGKFKHIFWVSDSAFEEFQFKGFIRKKSSVLYNVIDKNELLLRAEADAENYNSDVVYVGRLSYQKDPERLMKVLADVCRIKNDVKIAIVGEGEYSDYVSQFIADNSLNGNISYLGYKNNPIKLIRDSKLLVMTSRFEGTPMVALEAQILGVPVVSTPVDGMLKVIENGCNGYLSCEDENLVGHIVNILSDSELLKKLKENSLRRSMEYNDIDKFYDSVVSAYYNV